MIISVYLSNYNSLLCIRRYVSNLEQFKELILLWILVERLRPIAHKINTLYANSASPKLNLIYSLLGI